MMEMSGDSFKEFIRIANETGKYLEGEVLKLMETENASEENYIREARKLHVEKLRNNIKHQKKLIIKNLEIETLIDKLRIQNLELERKNEELEKENDGARSFRLDMEKLKASHTLKLASLKIILYPIFIVIILMILGSFFASEIDSNIVTMVSSIFGMIVGTILGTIFGGDKDDATDK